MESSHISSPDREVSERLEDAPAEFTPPDIPDKDSDNVDMDRGQDRQEISRHPSTHSFDATPSGEVRLRLPYIDSGLSDLRTGHGSRHLSHTGEARFPRPQEADGNGENLSSNQMEMRNGIRDGYRYPRAPGSISADWPAADLRPSASMEGRPRSEPFAGLGASSHGSGLAGERANSSSMRVSEQRVRELIGTDRWENAPGRSMERMVRGQGLLGSDSSGQPRDRFDELHHSQTHTCRRAPMRHREAATYDGSTGWRDYLIQFEMVAEINGWDDMTKALELATYLRGPAMGVLGDLRPEHRRNWEQLISALTARFEPSNQSELFRAQIKNRLRRKGESLSELAQDIKRLVRKAYPSAHAELREQLGRDCFVDSLNDSEMEWTIFQSKAETVDDALRSALEFEAFQKGRRTNGRQNVRMQRADGSGSDVLEDLKKRLISIEAALSNKTEEEEDKNRRTLQGRKPCHYCGRVGHWIKQCEKRKADIREGRYVDNRSHNRPAGQPSGNDA